MARTALFVTLASFVSFSCASPPVQRRQRDARAVEPPAAPAHEVRPPDGQQTPRPQAAPWALADLEDADYACTLGAWALRRARATRPATAWSGGAVVARITRDGPLDVERSAAIEWRGADGRGAFSVKRARVAWPAREGVPADAAVQVTAVAATRRALVVREEPADRPTRMLVIPATGPIAAVATPQDAPFDPVAFLALPDGAIAMQWASSLRDVVVVLEPDGRPRATRAFEWRVDGHGVLRSLARLGSRVGLVVEEPGMTESFMQFHDVDATAPAGPRFGLPRPLRLAPCARPAAAGDASLVDGWLQPRLATEESLPRLSATLELGPTGACLRSVESWSTSAGDQPSLALVAAGAGTLTGVLDDGARTRSVQCVPPGATPSTTACATVHIGLDLRALPTNSSASGIDMFSRGEAFDFVDKAPRSTPPEIRLVSEVGGFEATFRGAVEADVVALCERTVAAYLPTAPHLPILMESAAHVIEACHPCPEAGPGADRELVISRTIDATRRLLFEVYTDPAAAFGKARQGS